jgi:dTMP kinase
MTDAAPRSRPRRGRLIALEGIDGAGKSTLVRALGTALRRRGYSVRLHREPSDRTLGRLAQAAGAEDPWAGAIYFTVDRELAAPRLRAHLARYDVVLSDRSLFSTLAYQGSRLPPGERQRLGQLQRRATVPPDRVILLDLPISWLGRRLRSRAKARGPLERERALVRVARVYRQFARREHWVVLDARRPTRTLVGEALAALRLPRRRRASRGQPLKVRAGPGRSP